MFESKNCKYCGTKLLKYAYFEDNYIACNCPICGLYITNNSLDINDLLDDNKDNIEIKNSHIASYLFYNKISFNNYLTKKRLVISDNPKDVIYIQKIFDKKHSDFQGDYELINHEKIEQFSNQKMTELEDLFLNYVYEKCDKKNKQMTFSTNEINSATFIIRTENKNENFNQYIKLLIDLEKDEKIKIINNGEKSDNVIIEITLDGIKYIEGDKKMKFGNVGTVIDNSVNVNNATLTNSVVGNNNTTNFNYEELKRVVEEIEQSYKLEKKFSEEQLNGIRNELEELKIAINDKNQSGIKKCLKAIGGFVQNVTNGVIASGIWTMIQPYIL